MLVHRGVTPGTHFIHLGEERPVESSFLSKKTTRWQGLGLQPATFRSDVQHANHFTTVPPLHTTVPPPPLVPFKRHKASTIRPRIVWFKPYSRSRADPCHLICFVIP